MARSVVLVTGGLRSGKSRHAEALVADDDEVTYLATGPADDGSDTEWSHRLAAHRRRRPPSWNVIETRDVVGVVSAVDHTVVIDCLGTWVTGLVDEAALWDDLEAASRLVTTAGEALRDALDATSARVVLVTNEVGMAPVADTPSGRWFQDELGRVNALVSALADHVHLVVAGRIVDLSGSPVVR